MNTYVLRDDTTGPSMISQEVRGNLKIMQRLGDLRSDP